MFPVRTKLCASLVLFGLLIPTPSLGTPDAQQPHSRPRRVSPAPTENPPETLRDPAAATQPLPDGEEPTIRIGLSTDARSVTISSDTSLHSSTDSGQPASPLQVARVRIEARVAPAPAPVSPSGATVADASTHARNQPPADGSRAASRNDSAVGARQGSPARGEENNSGGVRLTSRPGPPLRSVLVYAAGTRPLLEARAPVVFSSEDAARVPVKLNEKPYRGRLEVFVNTRGTLSVVNVLGLEDYVRGVVPNELSPGGFPALEALKAQAVAARTYAVANRGRFAADGFDLLPTTRSQVYGGASTEHPLSDRAVAETRGRVATYGGRPIDALYTSTCGGHTEDAESIFGGAPVPYLRARACLVGGAADSYAQTLRTSRDLPDISAPQHSTSARDAALLSSHGFRLPSRLDDDWLAAPLQTDEARALLSDAATLVRRPAPPTAADANRPGGFSTALALALDGESRGAVLLNSADVDYYLSFRDAGDVPPANRADVAQLVRDGHLTLYPDATLRPRQPLTRARTLRTLAALLEARKLLRLQRATARAASGRTLTLHPAAKGPEQQLKVADGAHLFRAFGAQTLPVRELKLAGGEAVVYHTDAAGEIDYLEVSPLLNGAAADHVSNYSRWSVTLTPSEVSGRLARHAGDIGALLDLRVSRRGVSRRVLDLEVVGAKATAHVTSGRVRAALSLREQLFVIDRRFDESGRVAAYTFTGRGWGHGVGMCQTGAYGLARAGASYEKILKSYYTGISLTRMY